MKNNSNIPSKAEIKKLYESYAEYFAIVMENIIDILHAEVHLNAQPTYKSRVKSFNSYYKKILRLKPEETKDCSDSLVLLTDMMGIRMICAFLEDMQLGLEQIKKIFEIKEIEVKGAEKKFSEFGYESIHVLIKIPDTCKPPVELFEGLKPLDDNLVCEIQIRTILQDAWAEVEHELIYKTEFNPFDIPLRRKLASLNAMLSLADITFQEIRDYQNKLQKELEDRRHSFYDMADSILDEKPKEQTDNISRITPFVSGTIDEMLLRAIHCHNAGNLEEAVAIYSKILEAVKPDDKNVIAVIRKHRGMAYFSMNNFDAALQDFDISLQYDPKAFRTYYYKGIVCAIQKNYEWAIQNYTKSLEINEFQAHTYFRRAMAYFEIQEYEKSMNDLNNALNLGMPVEDCKVLQEKLTKKFGLAM